MTELELIIMAEDAGFLAAILPAKDIPVDGFSANSARTISAASIMRTIPAHLPAALWRKFIGGCFNRRRLLWWR